MSQAPSKATWRSTSIRPPTPSIRSAPTWSPPSTAWSRTWSVPRARSSTAMPTVRRAGTYNYWFNVTGPGDNTLFVDKSSTSAVQNGSPANPYQTISAALAAAAVDSQAGHHDIVRIEGNAGGIALIDANGNDITGNNLADQETFSVSDGTISVTFEFINSTLYPLTAVTPGDVAVAFTPGSRPPLRWWLRLPRPSTIPSTMTLWAYSTFMPLRFMPAPMPAMPRSSIHVRLPWTRSTARCRCGTPALRRWVIRRKTRWLTRSARGYRATPWPTAPPWRFPRT